MGRPGYYTTTTTTSLAPEATQAQDQTPPAAPDLAQLMLLFAARARADHEAMTYYAAALSAAIGLFIISHWLKVLRRSAPRAPGALVAVPRLLKKLTLKSGPGVPSVGHALVSVGYFALNVVFLFVHSDYASLPMLSVVAARSGWLGLANIAFTVFLSLRHTPLALLSAKSYERLKFLHGISGLMIVVQVAIHGACYTAVFMQQNNAARLRVADEIFGIIAAFMLLGMSLAAIVIRKMSYEVFYVFHVALFISALVFISLHHADIAEKILIVVGVAAGMWFLDFAARGLRLAFYSINNSATVFPLPNGGTKVVLKKYPSSARSGHHAYLWIPRVRFMETHPFTIAAADPPEFVISSHDGFTRDLHKYAEKNPGAILSASIHGPHGRMPDATKYDRVVLIAGGSGGSFIVGVARDLLKSWKSGSPQKIDFVWIVKNSGFIDWFEPHLRKLTQWAAFSISLHVTEDTTASAVAGQDSERRSPTDSLRGYIGDGSVEALRYKEGSVHHSSGFPVTPGRPDISAVIAAAVDECSPQDRVLVMGCGPDGLMKRIRSATASNMRVSGPSVDLHCEQFGW